jgi:D-beta-D-heptose 7-phosphate kinase / D-beta-D-heptose 1-phosphate adenosyltransferase
MRGGPLVVIGDALLDVDLEGMAHRLSPDAPVPVVDCQHERHRAGGAGLAAVLAAGMGGPAVTLVTALGNDGHGARLHDILRRHVEVLPLPLRGGTPCKVRVRASGQPLVRLDAGNGRAAPAQLDARVTRVLRGAGAILVSDYGRGMTAHPGLVVALACLPREIPVVWDPHPRGEPPVPGVRLATPNRAEARAFAAALGPAAAQEAGNGPGAVTANAGRPGAAVPGTPMARAARDASALARAWGTAVAVTLGQDGALLSVGDATPFVAPAAELDSAAALDSCGAGDWFAAAAARVLCAGGLLTEAVVEAVRGASAFVGRGGAAIAPGLTVPPTAAGPQRRRPAPAETAWDVVAGVRASGGKIVATGGCFDVLHAGHIGLLREARRLGDGLVVCLNSDHSVRALKGPGRPLVPEQDRARVLTALECVDAVLVFDESTPASLLERLRPDVWVKGGDYAHEELSEAAVVRRHGGEVMLLPYLDRHSTSRIVAAARGLAERGSALARGQE